MRRITFASLVLALVITACGAGANPLAPPPTVIPSLTVALPDLAGMPHIETQPYAVSWRGGRLASLPPFNSNSTDPFQMDLRSYDLTALDLHDAGDELAVADFDTRSKWPSFDKMPEDFDPAKILELGKNPGLGVNALHARGITGRGVGIGIIDQPLLTQHQEYADRLQWYEEIGWVQELPKYWIRNVAAMHGPAVASIAVGKTVGVAPGADLYYIGTTNVNTSNQYSLYAQGIHRLLAINDTLPTGRKIRVISMSLGWDPKRPGYGDITAAVKEANAQGILTIYTSKQREDGMGYQGLERSPVANPDTVASYEPGLFWAPNFYAGGYSPQHVILAPMDARTTAGPGGADEYVFYRTGGMSWPTPYIAGVYALAVQVHPTITPDQFWSLAVKTGRPLNILHEGKSYTLDSILDPAALIAALQ